MVGAYTVNGRDRLSPDALWAEVEPLIPPPDARPRGGGKTRLDNRAVVTAVVFVRAAAV